MYKKDITSQGLYELYLPTSGYQSLVQWGSLKSSCVRTRGFKSRIRHKKEKEKKNSLVTKAWSNGGASRALVFALVGSNPTSDRMSTVTKFFNVLVTMSLWLNG